jgi:hypothetical protein
MTLEEIYERYDRNWSEACRKLELPRSSIQKWRQRGGIPMKSQRRIEKRTSGIMKASFDHIGTYEC